MIVRGWLLVGAGNLPPERFRGEWFIVPAAAPYQPGDWIVLTNLGSSAAVCVDVPLA